MNKYASNADHVWNIDADCSSVDVDVTKMATEKDYDYLSINKNQYSGDDPFKVKYEVVLTLFYNENDRNNLYLIKIYFR